MIAVPLRARGPALARASLLLAADASAAVFTVARSEYSPAFDMIFEDDFE